MRLILEKIEKFKAFMKLQNIFNSTIYGVFNTCLLIGSFYYKVVKTFGYNVDSYMIIFQSIFI